jgi:hypothetical protein
MRNDFKIRNQYRGGGIAKRGLGAALRGGGIAKRGMGVALKEGGKADMAQDKALIKKAFKMHDAQEHKGEHTKLDKLKKGGMAKGKRSSAFESGKSKNKPYEAEEAYAKEEGGMKKGGRVKRKYGGKC